MKLLMIYANRFAYRTSLKSLDSVPENDEQKIIENAIVGFIHVEEKDEVNLSYIETKLIKNLKWAARKNNTERIVLHSFTHLSESKAGPEITKQLLDNSEQRLKKADYEVYQTPFGYFLDLDVDAPGTPLARLFKDM
ncbi:MAG: threonyl-tRNA synthetase editing domain-containing protein [candidate division Zixibacteria bacterium]|nr:threonyl-tRNA synthetase editing domain-containing protein [candidate division Zixibacteria bacterium]